jgi:hypothetical protein
MPKAVVTTKTGTTITMEGSEGELAVLLKAFHVTDRPEGTSRPRAERDRPGTRLTPTNLISDLIAGGFFKKPRELGEVKLALEEQGHFYPVTSLSPLMLRLVRRRVLRRLKENGRWLYVA